MSDQRQSQDRSGRSTVTWWTGAITAVLFFALGLGAGRFVLPPAASPASPSPVASSGTPSATDIEALAAAVRAEVKAAMAEAQPAAPALQVPPQSQQPQVVDVSEDDDPALGPDDAKVVVVEFSDYQCPFCTRFALQTFKPLLQQYGDQIRWVYRDFPIEGLHPQAQKAHEAANCVREQNEAKYWEIHDMLYERRDAWNNNPDHVNIFKGWIPELDLDQAAFDQCLDSGKYAAEVQADQRDGASYGVRGTPTFFINGQALVGAQPIEAFQQVIDAELAKAKD
jgi:protein-disulfide isomerase